MKDIKWFAILVGAVTDIGSTQVILMKFLIFALVTHLVSKDDLGSSLENQSLILIVPEMFLGGLGSFIGGFVCARMAKVAPIKNTFLMGIVSNAFGAVLARSSLTPGFFAIGAMVTFAAAILGGYLSLVLAREESAAQNRRR